MTILNICVIRHIDQDHRLIVELPGQTRPRDHAVGGTFRDIALYLSLKSCIALAGTFILKDPDRSGGPLLNYKTSR